MALRAKKEREEIDIKRKRKEGKVEELPDMYQNMYFPLSCALLAQSSLQNASSILDASPWVLFFTHTHTPHTHRADMAGF